MERKLVKEFTVPAEHGLAWEVKKDQLMRLVAIEGPQVGDMAIFNAHNLRETYDPLNSYGANCRMGTGDANTIRYLYSHPPRQNLMIEMTEDTVGRHWVICGGRCNKRSYERAGLTYNGRSCQDNLAEALAPYGLESIQVPDILNLWMNVTFTPEGRFVMQESLAQKGDYTEFLAHMDCLIALSACPAASWTPINGDRNKPIKVEIYTNSP